MAGEVEKVAELEGQVTDMETQISKLTKQLETAMNSNGDDTVKKATELEGTVADLTTQLQEVTKNLDLAVDALDAAAAEKEAMEKMIHLSPDQRTYYDSLAKAEDKLAFLDKEDEEKKKEMEAYKAADETVTLEGATISKAAVGEGTFKILKAQAERIAKTEKDLEIEKAARETAVLTKRADDEFKHVPGSVEDRAKMLGAIAKMDEPLRKAFEAVFTQSEKLAKAGFATLGKSDDGKPLSVKKALTDFETKVSEIAARDKVTKMEAASRARKQYPDLFKAYQGEEGQDAQ